MDDMVAGSGFVPLAALSKGMLTMVQVDACRVSAPRTLVSTSGKTIQRPAEAKQGRRPQTGTVEANTPKNGATSSHFMAPALKALFVSPKGRSRNRHQFRQV